MAYELETIIMREIGLGAHYSWYNGSECVPTRREAAESLTEVIQRYHDAGEEITPPDPALINVVKRIAKSGEKHDRSLTNTWKAASEVIAEHIIQTGKSEQERRAAFDRLAAGLERDYLQKKHRNMFYG